jgi:adenosylmethionine---8-amino-7-oxononanoate aminotransferase
VADVRGHRAPEPAVLDFDRGHLWHPYSSMTRPAAPYLVESASGTWLRLRVDGEPREVIDAMASWWCAIHGYAVPELDAAARAQLDRMSHVMFGGLTHSPAVELGRRLVGLAPGNGGGSAASPQLAAGSSVLDKVFLADSGSVAVEVAMKMAWQAQPGRRRMFTIRGGYHGDTFSCMSVCDPDGGMHAMYDGLLPAHLFAPRPPAGLDADLTRWRSEVTALFEPHARQIAAIIVEPVLQGAGGMYAYPPAAVRFLADLARAHGALVIFDEIATGLWRTGTAWAADRPVDVPAVTRTALDAGVWVRPFRNLVYTMPPFICTADDLATITTGIVSAIKQVHG